VLGDAGLFQPAVDLDTGVGQLDTSFHSIALGDLDGDGNVDLAIAAYQSGEAGVAFGAGNGSFRPVARVDAGIFFSDLLVAGVGMPPVQSLAMAGQDPSGRVGIIFVQSPNGVPQVTTVIPTPDGQASWMSAADFNGDGLIDFATTTGNEIDVFVANNAGGWAQTAAISGNASTRDFVGDFNEDGIPDIVVGTSLEIFFGRGDGSFPDSGILLNRDADYWLAGDLNADGHRDLLLFQYLSSVSVLLGHGDGTFTLGRSPGLSATTSPWMLIDLDGDGRLDYLGAGHDNSVHYALGNGDGTFQAEVALRLASESSGANLAQVLSVDVNNDGRPDVLASTFGNGHVSLFLNSCP
jgi:hypothetical protein